MRLPRGAIGFGAVKHLVLCRIERRPPRLDMTIYPYLPKASTRWEQPRRSRNRLRALQRRFRCRRRGLRKSLIEHCALGYADATQSCGIDGRAPTRRLSN